MRAEEAIYLNTQEQFDSPNDAESEAMKEAIFVLGRSSLEKIDILLPSSAIQLLQSERYENERV